MNARLSLPGRIARLLAGALSLVWLLAACAPGGELVRSGNELIEQGKIDEGLSRFEKALALEPGNTEYRLLAMRQREAQVQKLIKQGDAARKASQFEAAQLAYQQALKFGAGNHRARAGIEDVEQLRRQQQRLGEVEAALAQGHLDEAEQRLRQVLAENPNDARALVLRRQLDEQQPDSTRESADSMLKARLNKSVALDFRDANLKAVFEALSHSTGINFVFDRDVKSGTRVTLSVSNLSADDVISVIAVTNQLGRKTLNENTVLIYPNTPDKQKDYIELVVKTFYLANAEAKAVLTMLKTVLKTNDLYADDALNTITMRDTPDAISLAEKLIASQDLSEPEVMLDVEVLEVARSRMTEIGIDAPGKFTVLNIVQNPSTVLSTAGALTEVKNNTLTTTQLTADRLRGIRGSSLGIDSPSVNLRAENGDTNILANPRIRVKNHEKAQILIGDRVPVITTTSMPNVGTSESVSYLDVGLKLNVEPKVFLNNEVGMKFALEVSNIVKEVRSQSGSLSYQVGTRLTTTELRLQDGETQMLAGLIRDEDRGAADGLPWLIDLPVLGRLFSSKSSGRNKTEIVLLITPRVVRNLDPGIALRSEQLGGTEKSVGTPPLLLQGDGKLSMAPSRGDVTSSLDPAAPNANLVENAAAAEQGEQPEVRAGGARQRTPRRRAAEPDPDP
jgi:general secretion pathway protein D